MSPLVTTDTDDFRSMITFRTSTIYEMCLSLGELHNPSRRHQDWAKETSDRLPGDLLDDVHFLHGRFENGILLMELAVDYPDHHDVEGFLDYVQQMATTDFLFYVLGRLAPKEEMGRLEPNMESLLSAIAYSCSQGCADLENKYATEEYLELLANPDGYRTRIVRLWKRYWEEYFKEASKAYRQTWEDSIREKSLALSGQDPVEFVKGLANKAELPDQIPPEYPTQEIILIPTCFGPPHMTFVGYGSTTVIYDCHITEERREELERLEEEIIGLGKALSDKTRLRLLKWIVREPSLYGRKLAEMCHVSQPSVSRHLGILKEARLIQERPRDNYIAYRACREQIEKLSPQLLAYLYELE